MDFIEPWNSTWHFGSRLCRKKGVGIEIETRRMRGRPKRRWLDNVKYDITQKDIFGEGSATWRRVSTCIDHA